MTVGVRLRVVPIEGGTFGVWDNQLMGYVSQLNLTRADAEAFAAELGRRRAEEDGRRQPADITVYLYDERPAREQTVEIREGWGTGRRVGTLTTWARHRTEPGWWGLVIDRATREGHWHSAGDLHPFSEFG